MAEENHTNNQNDQNSYVKFEKLQADLDQAINNWKRTAADFENYKKQKEKESGELIQFAREVTVAKLLPIIDSLEQALRHLPKYTTPSLRDTPPRIESGAGSNLGVDGASSPPDKEEYPPQAGEVVKDFAKQYENWQVGVNGIIAQLDKTFGELGVQKIESLGKKFDPHFHEAVREVESEKDDGIIVDELQIGFILNGKVIRPSQVIISKRAASIK